MVQRMIRIRADCKLSAKPPLIGLKSDHRERSSVSSRARLSFVCICTGEKSWRECIEGEYAIGGKGGGDILHTEKLPQNELHHGVDRLPGNANSSLPLTLSLFPALMRSLPRARFLFVLQYSPVTRPVVSEYRGICKFWVELGQLTRARSNQRFWGRGRGRGRGKMDWLFFFFTSIRFFFFFFFTSNQKRDTWNLPLVVCISSTFVTLCDREIYLGYKIHGNVFCLLSFFILRSTIYSFNVTGDGER